MQALFFDLAFVIYAIAAAPFFIAKGKHKEGWNERWARFSPDLDARFRNKRVIWIHAVSAGEARLACHFASEMRPRVPDAHFLVTVTTASGKAIARQRLAPEDTVLYFPFDLSGVMKRFLDRTRPQAAVIMETEIWPNLLIQLKRRGIPAVIVNARISDGAFRRYRRAKLFLEPSFRSFRFCLAQSRQHADRFARLGVPQNRIRVTGNLKFDLENDSRAKREDLDAVFSRLKMEPDAALFFCSSTHAGEEEILLSVYLRLKGLYPDLRLVLIPRHTERLGSIESLIRKKGLSSVRLSELLGGKRESMSEILLVDVWGVLHDIYPYADLVFMGGSLVPTGGHNIAEPAFAGRPVIYGPHMHNFVDMTDEFEKEGAVRKVRNEAELESAVRELLKDAGARNAMGQKARDVVLKNRGATKKSVESVSEALRFPDASLYIERK